MGTSTGQPMARRKPVWTDAGRPSKSSLEWHADHVVLFCSQTDCTDGTLPDGGLVEDTNGKLYGTAPEGRASDACSANGRGTVFSLSLVLGPFVETQPNSAPVGKPINILGSSLEGATSVTFNGNGGYVHRGVKFLNQDHRADRRHHRHSRGDNGRGARFQMGLAPCRGFQVRLAMADLCFGTTSLHPQGHVA
jgi:hypothetical protein